jgi:predicted dehydrogenase
MKILIIGTGGIGRRHAQTIAALRPDATFLAIRAEHSEATSELAMQLVPDLDAAIVEAPDAAVVALPPVLHAEMVRSLIGAEIPTYVEKPVAMRADEIESIVTDAEKRGVVTMTGCNLRFLPAFQTVRDLITEGKIGTIRHAQLSCGQWLPDWRPHRDYRETYSAQFEMGGGVLRDLIHEIDLARFWFGEFPKVTARMGNTGALDIDCEDHADLILSQPGLTVSIHLDYLDRTAHRQGRIIGENGTLVYDVINGRLCLHRVNADSEQDLAGREAFDLAKSTRAALRHFLQCVEREEPTQLPLREGLRSLALVDRARSASRAAI